MPTGEFISPDGYLKLLIKCPDCDWTIGFEGFPWHTHGSILAGLSGQDEASSIERFLADLTGNVSVISVSRISGELKDVWVTDNPAKDMLDCKKYGEPTETIEFRRWNGTAVRV